MHREINHSNVQFQRIARTSRWRKMLPGALLRTSGDKKASANSSIAIFKADVNNAESLISGCKKTKLVVYVGPLQKVVETAWKLAWITSASQGSLWGFCIRRRLCGQVSHTSRYLSITAL